MSLFRISVAYIVRVLLFCSGLILGTSDYIYMIPNSSVKIMPPFDIIHPNHCKTNINQTKKQVTNDKYILCTYNADATYEYFKGKAYISFPFDRVAVMRRLAATVRYTDWYMEVLLRFN